jgi:hypothetical protein
MKRKQPESNELIEDEGQETEDEPQEEEEAQGGEAEEELEAEEAAEGVSLPIRIYISYGTSEPPAQAFLFYRGSSHILRCLVVAGRDEHIGTFRGGVNGFWCVCMCVYVCVCVWQSGISDCYALV